MQQTPMASILVDLISKPTPESIFELAHQTILERFEAQSCGIFLFDRANKQFTHQYGNYITPELPSAEILLESLEGWVMRENMSALALDYLQDSRVSLRAKPFYEAAPPRHPVAIVPCGQQGILIVMGPELNLTSLNEIRLLADGIGLALGQLQMSKPDSPDIGMGIYQNPKPINQFQHQSKLSRALQQLENHQAAIISLTGEAGTGKTILLDWLIGEAKNNGVQSLRVRASDSITLYALWRKVLLSLFPALGKQAPTPENYRRFLSKLNPDWGVRASLLLDVMQASHLKDNELSHFAPSERHKARANMIGDLLLSVKPSLLLVIEDADYLDIASQNLLSTLVPWVKASAAKLILVVSSQKAPQWQASEQLKLSQWEDSDLGELLSFLDTQMSLTPELKNAITSAAKGNSLHARILLHLAQNAQLSNDSPFFSLSLAELIDHLITQLPTPAQEILLAAATLGPESPLGLLAASLKRANNDKFQQDLALLKLFLDQTTDQKVAFRHVLYQERASTLSSENQKQTYHQLSAKYLEKEQAQAIELIAHHYRHTIFPSQARHYLIQAAHLAHARAAYELAADYIQFALEVAPRTDAIEQVVILNEQVDLFHERQDIIKEHQALERLSQLTQDAQDAWLFADVGWRWLRYYLSQSKIEQGLAQSTSLANYALEAHHTPALAEIHILTAALHQSKKSYENAQEHLDQAISVSKRVKNIGLGARILANLGHLLAQSYNYDLSQACYEQALEIYKRMGNVVGQASCFQALGEVYYSFGYYGMALACLEQAKTLWAKIGNLTQYSQSAFNHILILFHQNKTESALTQLQLLEKPIQQLGDPLMQGQWWLYLGRVYHQFDQFDSSLDAYQKALQILPPHATALRMESYAWGLYTTKHIPEHASIQDAWLRQLQELTYRRIDMLHSPYVYLALAQFLPTLTEQESILKQGQKLLAAEAAWVSDANMRQRFLERPDRNALSKARLPYTQN